MSTDTPAVPAVPVPVPDYVRSAATLLIGAVDADIEAAALIIGKHSTKDMKTWLTELKVPAQKIASFLPVYRAYRQAVKGENRPIADVRNIPTAILRDIGKAIADDKPVTKATWDAAISGATRMDVLATFDPEKSAELTEKARIAALDKAQAKAYDLMTPAQKAAHILMQAKVAIAELGLTLEGGEIVTPSKAAKAA